MQFFVDAIANASLICYNKNLGEGYSRGGTKMKIDIVPVYGKLLSNHISCSTVIVVDVLRSTSCITMAVKNGAERVIPAVDPGEAASIAGRLGLKAGRGTRGHQAAGFQPGQFACGILQGKRAGQNGGHQHLQWHGGDPRIFRCKGCAHRRDDQPHGGGAARARAGQRYFDRLRGHGRRHFSR